MNRNLEASLLEAAVAKLGELGLVAIVEPTVASPDRGGDATVTLHSDGKALRYRAEVKQALRPSLIGPISIIFSDGGDDRLLITDYVTPPVAELLRCRGIQFIDAAGNAYLRRRGLLIFVTGRHSSAPRPAVRTLRVFRPSGLKVIFALISVPNLVIAPQRDIARAAGVALGSVAQVLEGLRELGFLADLHGTRRLLDRGRLITQWTEAYARLLDAKFEMARFSAPSAGWWRRTDPTQYGAQWGGETAAALLQGGLVPERTIVYAENPPGRMLSKHRLKADPAGNVVLRRRFWHFEVESSRADVVPPLLIYADLVATGDARSLTAAKQIRNAYLD